MSHKEEMITSSTPSIKLRLRRDYPLNKPICVLVCHHWITMHLEFFDGLTKEMNKSDILVYRYDARGHGKSEGKKGYIKTIFEMVEDLKYVIDLAKKENPNLPIFLIGHSLGGQISALFVTKYPNELNGVITLAGCFRENMKIFGNVSLEKDPKLFLPIKEAFNIKDKENLDPEEIARMDPLVLVELSISIIKSVYEGINYLKKECKKLDIPIFIINGSIDNMVSEKDAIEFYMETEAKDKSLSIYSGFGHNSINEKNGNLIVNHVIEWIRYRIQ